MMHKTKEKADQSLTRLEGYGYSGEIVRWKHTMHDRTLIRYNVKLTHKPQDTK